MPSTQQLGRFGTAAEFNNLGAGSFVNPNTQLGLRPVFRVGLGIGGHTSGFWASPYPAMSTYIQSGFDWLGTFPQVGGVVLTEARDPVNVICSVPYLVSAPVPLTPEYPDNVSRATWEAAGFDPDRQSVMWLLPDGNRLGLIANLYAQGYNLINQGTGVTLGPSVDRSINPYTEGLRIDPRQDFASIGHTFALLPHDEKFLPAGEYRFQLQLTVIPRSFAYESSSAISIVDCYHNVNVLPTSQFPTTQIEVVGQMPAPFPLPEVRSINPPSGAPGTVVEFSGSLLGRTQDVSFSPDALSMFQVVSDNL